jgi:Ser/Thr protein kinase RdoA (MazF antagonist)
MLYKIVHLDNIFYDISTDTPNIIDFDDSMYHWYAMDIEQADDEFKDAFGNDNEG